MPPKTKELDLTRSIVMEAIKIARNKNEESGAHNYTQSQVRRAFRKVNTKNSPYKNNLAKLTEGQMIKAVDTIISKRHTFLFILYPLRRFIPDWLLVEVPLGFLDYRIQNVGFIDRLFKK